MSLSKFFVSFIILIFLYNKAPAILNSLTRDKIQVHDLPVQGDLLGFLKDNDTILLYDKSQSSPFALYNITQNKITRFSIEKFFVGDKGALHSPLFHRSPVWGMGYGGMWCLDENDHLLINDGLHNMHKEALKKLSLKQRTRYILDLDLKDNVGKFTDVGKTVYAERSAPIFLDELECKFYIEKKDAESACGKPNDYLKCLNHIAFTETPPEGTNSHIYGIIAKNILTGYLINGRKKASLVDKLGKARDVPPEHFFRQEQAFYDAKTKTTYRYNPSLNLKAWPMWILAFDENGELKEEISIPMPPFVGHDGLGLRYFSAGPDTYRHLNLSHLKNTFFAVVTGASVVNDAQGIYALYGQEWKKILKIKPHSRYLFDSPDGCKVVWEEWDDPEEKKRGQKAIVYVKYANICDALH